MSINLKPKFVLHKQFYGNETFLLLSFKKIKLKIGYCVNKNKNKILPSSLQFSTVGRSHYQWVHILAKIIVQHNYSSIS